MTNYHYTSNKYKFRWAFYKVIYLLVIAVIACCPYVSAQTVNSIKAIRTPNLPRSKPASPSIVKKDFALAEYQYQHLLEEAKDPEQYPRSINSDGSVSYVSIKDWTGGFWPGALWLLYQYTHDDQWKKAAIKWTESLKNNQFNTSNHDLGFMMYCSYGNAYRLTADENYKKVLIQSAKSLCSRFNPKVGCIKSWDSRLSLDKKTHWEYPVIIDNMMNLELLFFASKITGDTIYRNIAVKHAETTLKNHIRADFSTYHVVNYDATTGKILNRQTCQGYSDNSTWARGQAWAIYGFTMVYRETHDKRFLFAAKNLADFYLNNKNLPADKIPYWDFNVNQEGYIPDWDYDKSKYRIIPRDASAAAIVSSALLELGGDLGNMGKKYQNAAIQMLRSLSSSQYLAENEKNGNFLLKHAVGNFPLGSEIDVPIIYGDYYFLEALLRYRRIATMNGHRTLLIE